MTKRVLVTDYVWPSVEPERAVLAAAGAELVIAPDGNEETLAALAKDVDGILTCFAKVTDKVVRAATKATVIGRYGVGLDNIAVDTATELGIIVTNVPDYCVDEVSTHAMALLLALNRQVVLWDTSTKKTGWGSVPLNLPLNRLRGKKLGIIGFGKIGKATAVKARGFGMEVLANSSQLTDAEAARNGVKKVTLDDLLKESDFVSLHTPLTPATKNIIGRRELALMKPTANLINTARGPLIDEEALYDALSTGKLAGAAVDVVVDIHPPLGHKLLQLPNLIVTPHVAFYSPEAVLELEQRAAGEVASVLQGKMPANVVNPKVLSRARAKVG
ncbi:MAG: C-terminal binding protein [SAR202 cluster bacterium]|nr:C-terminal binding protein [SAR202 cluster bacterium]